MHQKVVSGVSCGTLGELFQGPYWDGPQPDISIISLPVEKYSWCYYVSPPGANPDVDDLFTRPKAARAVDLFLHRYGRTLPPGRWEFHSELPVGKGMASSTADIVAAIRCLYNIFEIPYDQREVIDILRSIERSDTVFLGEFTLYLSQKHQIVHTFGNRIGLFTCYIVEDSTVATEALTDQLLDHYRRATPDYQRCLDGMVSAFRRDDARGVAGWSTMSAELSQQVLPKATFDPVVANQRTFGADGVFVAHTGSVIGYLFATRPRPSIMEEMSAFFRDLGSQCYFAKGGWGHV